MQHPLVGWLIRVHNPRLRVCSQNERFRGSQRAARDGRQVQCQEHIPVGCSRLLPDDQERAFGLTQRLRGDRPLQRLAQSSSSRRPDCQDVGPHLLDCIDDLPRRNSGANKDVRPAARGACVHLTVTTMGRSRISHSSVGPLRSGERYESQLHSRLTRAGRYLESDL